LRETDNNIIIIYMILSIAMNKHAEDRPEYAWLREFKTIHGNELRKIYGAHSIGIGWKRVDGKKTNQLALIFYVERKSHGEMETIESIPSTITFKPSNLDENVQLKTDVVESTPSKLE